VSAVVQVDVEVARERTVDGADDVVHLAVNHYSGDLTRAVPGRGVQRVGGDVLRRARSYRPQFVRVLAAQDAHEVPARALTRGEHAGLVDAKVLDDLIVERLEEGDVARAPAGRVVASARVHTDGAVLRSIAFEPGVLLRPVQGVV